VLGDEGWSGRERGGPGPVALVDHLGGASVGAGSAPLAITGLGTSRTSAQQGGWEVRGAGHKRLTRLGFAGQGGAASLLQGVECFGTLLAPRRVDGAACLRRARRGVDAEPAWRHPAGARRQRVIARACMPPGQRLRVSVGQHRVGCADGCWPARAPRQVGRGELLAVGFTVEGAIRHQRGHAVGGLTRMHMGAHGLATGEDLTAVATARVPQNGHAGVRRHQQCHHAGVEVRPMRPAVPSDEVHDRVRGLCVAVVTSIDMNAWAIEMRQAGHEAPVLGSGRNPDAFWQVEG
jgi:hypothetical protein